MARHKSCTSFLILDPSQITYLETKCDSSPSPMIRKNKIDVRDITIDNTEGTKKIGPLPPRRMWYWKMRDSPTYQYQNRPHHLHSKKHLIYILSRIIHAILTRLLLLFLMYILLYWIRRRMFVDMEALLWCFCLHSLSSVSSIAWVQETEYWSD